MINIPKLPPKEELLFQEKSFFQSVYEQLHSSRSLKVLGIILGILVVVSFPASGFLKQTLAERFISSYQPPVVNTMPYNPQALEVLRTGIIENSSNRYSLFAQVRNSNFDISARIFQYRFVIKGSAGNILSTKSGHSFLFASENKYLLDPLLELEELPVSVDLEIAEVKWTKRVATVEVKLSVFGQNSGVTAEGNFFFEGLLRNEHGFLIKRVELPIVVFDPANEHIVAVNQTVITDLLPFESRYFRVTWPQVFRQIGLIETLPSVDSLEPGILLEAGESVPVR